MALRTRILSAFVLPAVFAVGRWTAILFSIGENQKNDPCSISGILGCLIRRRNPCVDILGGSSAKHSAFKNERSFRQNIKRAFAILLSKEPLGITSDDLNFERGRKYSQKTSLSLRICTNRPAAFPDSQTLRV